MRGPSPTSRAYKAQVVAERARERQVVRIERRHLWTELPGTGHSKGRPFSFLPLPGEGNAPRYAPGTTVRKGNYAGKCKNTGDLTMKGGIIQRFAQLHRRHVEKGGQVKSRSNAASGAGPAAGSK